MNWVKLAKIIVTLLWELALVIPFLGYGRGPNWDVITWILAIIALNVLWFLMLNLERVLE